MRQPSIELIYTSMRYNCVCGKKNQLHLDGDNGIMTCQGCKKRIHLRIKAEQSVKNITVRRTD